jgi:hypothetical protein
VQLLPKEADAQRIEGEIKLALQASDFEEAAALQLELKALSTEEDREEINKAMGRIADAPQLHHEVKQMQGFLEDEQAEAIQQRDFYRAAGCKAKLVEVARYLAVFERMLPEQITRLSVDIAEASVDVSKFKAKLDAARKLDIVITDAHVEDRARLENMQEKLQDLARTKAWPKTDAYSGERDAAGRYHGANGELIFANFPFTGDAYTGQFEGGRMHGAGTYLSANSDVFAGTWKAGKRHGQGVHTYCSGRKEVRVYRNGLRLSDAQVEAERKAKRAGIDPAVAMGMPEMGLGMANGSAEPGEESMYAPTPSGFEGMKSLVMGDPEGAQS